MISVQRSIGIHEKNENGDCGEEGGGNWVEMRPLNVNIITLIFGPSEDTS